MTFLIWIVKDCAQTIAQDLAIDPASTEKLAFFQDLFGFGRRNIAVETGWATRPGSDTPDSDLADACLAGLALDGS